MPFINTKVNVKISDSVLENLKTKYGKAISLIPGKSEEWLMLNFEDDCRMYFKGKAAPMAFIEVKIYGKGTPEGYKNLTAELTNIISGELNIKPEQVFIKYEEIGVWGWNGNNL